MLNFGIHNALLSNTLWYVSNSWQNTDISALILKVYQLTCWVSWLFSSEQSIAEGITMIGMVQLSSNTVTVLPTWCHYQIETFSVLLALCEGNSSMTGGFPSQRPINCMGLWCLLSWCLLSVTGGFPSQRASNMEYPGTHVMHWVYCSGSLEPQSSCHDRDWIMELPMEADILTFTGILTPEDASVASCFPFDITISLSWFPLLSIPPSHSAIP